MIVVDGFWFGERLLSMAGVSLLDWLPTQLINLLGILSSMLRIPRHLDTQPTIIWTLVPCSLGHLIHVHLDRQSERSDAGLHC